MGDHDAVAPARVPDLTSLAEQMVAKARETGIELTGQDGLLTALTRQVLQSALEEEMAAHLGYDKHDPVGRGSGNSRNGTTPKTVTTEIGQVTIDVPRDRLGTFEPQVVKKHQRRLTGFDEAVISLYAKGMTTGDIAKHLADVYDTDVSRDLVSRVTDKVLDEMVAWQSRPLDPVYPVVLIDAIVLKVREGSVANRPVYVAMGVNLDGERDVLGMWTGPSGGEGAKQWMNMLTPTAQSRHAGRMHRVLRRPCWACRRPLRRSGHRRPCRPAWCTWCATASGMRRSGTGAGSPPSCGASTPRRPWHPRSRGSRTSRTSGNRPIRRWSGCGAGRGRSSCRSWTSRPRSAS